MQSSSQNALSSSSPKNLLQTVSGHLLPLASQSSQLRGLFRAPYCNQGWTLHPSPLKPEDPGGQEAVSVSISLSQSPTAPSTQYTLKDQVPGPLGGRPRSAGQMSEGECLCSHVGTICGTTHQATQSLTEKLTALHAPSHTSLYPFS